MNLVAKEDVKFQLRSHLCQRLLELHVLAIYKVLYDIAQLGGSTFNQVLVAAACNNMQLQFFSIHAVQC